MKKIIMLLAVLGLAGAISMPAVASPAEDLKQFREHFKKKFPTVKFDNYANGLYTLPGNEDYRDQWQAFNEFPPYELGSAEGKKDWETPFPNGKTFASCFKNGGKNIAQGYPYWDDKNRKVRTAEMDLMDCAKKNGGTQAFLKADLDKDTKARVALANLTAYFYGLSKGQRVSVDLSSPARSRPTRKARNSGGRGKDSSISPAPTVTWTWPARTSAAANRCPRAWDIRSAGRRSARCGDGSRRSISATKPASRRGAPSP